jgi:hypothetical protein
LSKGIEYACPGGKSGLLSCLSGKKERGQSSLHFVKPNRIGSQLVIPAFGQPWLTGVEHGNHVLPFSSTVEMGLATSLVLVSESAIGSGAGISITYRARDVRSWALDQRQRSETTEVERRFAPQGPPSLVCSEVRGHRNRSAAATWQEGGSCVP